MTGAPLVLGFDTSGPYLSVALWDGHSVLAEADEDMARGQAERLMPLLETVLQGAGATWQDLSALGVGIGPGNFTGIRLSVSAARGLALSLGIPAVGVSLLEAVALDGPRPALACLSAPRGACYVQGLGSALDIPAQQIGLADIPDTWRQTGLCCIGSAAGDVADRLQAVTARAAYAPGAAIARIAALQWREAPARPAPMYLRPADAAPSRDLPPVILDDA